MRLLALAFLVIRLMFVPISVAAQDQPAQRSGETANAPPSDAKPEAPVTRIRVGGNVMSARITKLVTPKYPDVAKRAKICGTIVLHAIIAKDGSIHDLKYVSGPPLLMKAALDAVRQWRYSTTLLEGRPVEVDTTINVVFELKGCKPAEENAQPQTQSTSPPAPAPQY